MERRSYEDLGTLALVVEYAGETLNVRRVLQRLERKEISLAQAADAVSQVELPDPPPDYASEQRRSAVCAANLPQVIFFSEPAQYTRRFCRSHEEHPMSGLLRTAVGTLGFIVFTATLAQAATDAPLVGTVAQCRDFQLAGSRIAERVCGTPEELAAYRTARKDVLARRSTQATRMDISPRVNHTQPTLLGAAN